MTNTYRKRYNSETAAWLFYPCSRQQVTELKQLMQSVRPAWSVQGCCVRVHGNRRQIEEVELYLATAGWADSEKLEQTYRELSW